MNDILDTAAFTSELEQIAQSSGKPAAGLRAEAARDLAEMQAQRSALAVRLFAGLSRFVYRRGYRHQPVFDLDELERLRAESQRRSIVYLVTHKTYLDFFVLFDFLYRQGISTPYIFGGLNMNFAGFGGLARRAGGILIRRSFRDDAVYKAVLHRYIESLIQAGSSFMWAIEGTRSRTGKLVRPRLGLLNYVGNISRKLGDDLISYIPVSVAYDQIPDVVDMAAEEAGARKTPESLAWFMRYVRRLGGNFGQIYLRFGEAMTLSETPGAPDFASLRGLVGEQQIEIQKLAFEACYRINEITPATITSLVLMALLCRGSSSDAQVHQDVAILNHHVQRMVGRGAFSKPSRALSTDPAPVIEALIASGVVGATCIGKSRVLDIIPARISIAIYYSNMAVHHFVVSAIAELALYSAALSSAAEVTSRFWAECLRLRKLFKFEFFFSRTEVFREQLQSELDEIDPGWQQVLQLGGDAVMSMLRKKPLLVAHGVLSPFMVNYRVVGEALSNNAANRNLPDREFLEECLESAHPTTSDPGASKLPGVSRALLANGLRVADNRGLRAGRDADTDKRTADFLLELEYTSQCLEKLHALAQAK